MFACLDAKGENYIVEVDLPGVNREHIDLSMYEDIIHGHLHFPIKVNPKKAKAKFRTAYWGEPRFLVFGNRFWVAFVL